MLLCAMNQMHIISRAFVWRKKQMKSNNWIALSRTRRPNTFFALWMRNKFGVLRIKILSAVKMCRCRWVCSMWRPTSHRWVAKWLARCYCNEWPMRIQPPNDIWRFAMTANASKNIILLLLMLLRLRWKWTKTNDRKWAPKKIRCALIRQT